VEAELFHANRETGRLDEAKVASRNFAKAPLKKTTPNGCCTDLKNPRDGAATLCTAVQMLPPTGQLPELMHTDHWWM